MYFTFNGTNYPYGYGSFGYVGPDTVLWVGGGESVVESLGLPIYLVGSNGYVMPLRGSYAPTLSLRGSNQPSIDLHGTEG